MLLELFASAGNVSRATDRQQYWVQVSADVRMLLPLLVGILVAKWVADAATHSLYHGLLDVKCIPWLPPQPATTSSLDLLPVKQAMAAPVALLPEITPLDELRTLLRETGHNGFPVVRPTAVGKVGFLATSGKNSAVWVPVPLCLNPFGGCRCLWGWSRATTCWCCCARCARGRQARPRPCCPTRSSTSSTCPQPPAASSRSSSRWRSRFAPSGSCFI